MRALKSPLDSTYGAIYYPWVVTANPAHATNPAEPDRIAVPPSGAVCGVYARTDIARGVWKAPANETVAGALDLQRHVRFGEQEVLNPLGVNCIRALPNRGIRVWGARTLSSDPEWQYVNVRRYFIYLQASIDRGTQWAVFEPNGERLWDNVRTTVEDFLYNEWITGRAARGHAAGGVFRPLRPRDHDPERHRQRPPDLSRRRGRPETRRVRHLPHRAEDGERARLTERRNGHARHPLGRPQLPRRHRRRPGHCLGARGVLGRLRPRHRGHPHRVPTGQRPRDAGAQASGAAQDLRRHAEARRHGRAELLGLDPRDAHEPEHRPVRC
jgi:hypothetical protein